MNIPKHMQVKRKPSSGMVLMSERFQAKKTAESLVAADVTSFKHFACRRNFSSSEGSEGGYLVVGKTTITFLAEDNSSVLCSHPLAFLESWGRDLHDDKRLSYTVKPKSIKSLFVKDDLYTFSFSFDSSDLVNQIIGRLDKFVLLAHHKDGPDKPNLDMTFLDPSRPEAVHAEPTDAVPGERFACELQREPAEKIALMQETEEAVVILHPRGIICLTRLMDATERGKMTIYSFGSIESFGAASPTEFGIKVGDKFVVFRTEESGHLINTLAMRNLTALQENSANQPAFPLAYHPPHAADEPKA